MECVWNMQIGAISEQGKFMLNGHSISILAYVSPYQRENLNFQLLT